MITKFKKSFEPFIVIIASPFISWNPSILTFLSLLSTIVFFFGIIGHIYWLSLLSIFGFTFDALDGYVARKSGKTSPFGAFLDSTLDRISDFLIISSFGFSHLVNWELTVLVIFTSFLISYIQTRAEGIFREKPKAIGFMQRTERIVFILVAFFIFLIFPNLKLFHLPFLTFSFLLILILNIITIFQRFIFVANFSK